MHFVVQRVQISQRLREMKAVFIICERVHERRKQLMIEDKFNSALDNIRKAFKSQNYCTKEEITLISRRNFNLQKFFEKVCNAVQAKEIFDRCLKYLDGR